MKTKHKEDCIRVFSRYDDSCPRCNELINGAPARKGWGDKKRTDEEARIKSIREHSCEKSVCGVVCTFGDW